MPLKYWKMATGHNLHLLFFFRLKTYFLLSKHFLVYRNNVIIECVHAWVTPCLFVTGKSVVGMEEYSFSQSTLEQVFLSFAKKQLTEEEQAARDRLALNNGQENSGYDDDAL